MPVPSALLQDPSSERLTNLSKVTQTGCVRVWNQTPVFPALKFRPFITTLPLKINAEGRDRGRKEKELATANIFLFPMHILLWIFKHIIN